MDEKQKRAEAREVEILTRYANREISRARAGALLKCSERQINRKMDEHELERVESARRTRAELTAAVRTIRENAARLVVSEGITPKQAAKRAGCSPRTIYRYVRKLEAAAKAAAKKAARKK